jgi:hypothetical protein
MIRKVLVSSVIALFISSAPALAAETSEVKAASITIPSPPEGQGQVVFFRTGGTGFAVGCSVNENGQKVSSLGAGRYFVMVAPPGRHEFTVKSEAKDSLALEVEAGETQYVTCRMKMGLIVARPDLAPSTEAAFRKNAKLKLVDAEDMGPGEGALRPDQLAAAISASSK